MFELLVKGCIFRIFAVDSVFEKIPVWKGRTAVGVFCVWGEELEW